MQLNGLSSFDETAFEQRGASSSAVFWPLLPPPAVGMHDGQNCLMYINIGLQESQSRSCLCTFK